jgi:hypothetical protein
VIGVPELLRGFTARILPDGWGELGSIPGAMLTLRSALEPGRLDVLLAMRAAAVLALVAAVALLAVRAELARLGEASGSPGVQSGEGARA